MAFFISATLREGTRLERIRSMSLTSLVNVITEKPSNVQLTATVLSKDDNKQICLTEWIGLHEKKSDS